MNAKEEIRFSSNHLKTRSWNDEDFKEEDDEVKVIFYLRSHAVFVRRTCF